VPDEAKKSEGARAEKLDNKTYLKELERLHVELVRLQEWAVKSGAKVCELAPEKRIPC